MADVAELAGVSAMTVSRVLNVPDRVRPATRARVLAAMRRLDYHPNLAARVLATGRSRLLGVVGLDTTRYGPASILAGIERAAREHDYRIGIAGSGGLGRGAISEGVNRLRGQDVDGVIIMAPHEPVAEALLDLPPDLPVVVVDAAEDLPVPLAAVDQQDGAVRATRYLLSLGHPTVWHVSGPAGWVGARTRAGGWRATLAAEGREIPEVLQGDWSARSGYELGRRIARDPSVTAVFAASDTMALGLLRALDEAGRRVPEEVSVVGFDDVPESSYFSPPLTTVRQDFGEVGRRAFMLMLDSIAPPGFGRCRGRDLVEPELVVRESTGTPS
ncbi:LacI family DNA-binding transcriptional regulator [Actinomadura fibrosa]|uniref:LacI family DNA-binding transcriptional regulator n=1 Tax=Actinomadura fibrosa TaxID=111802 RepID=A0ABW2XHM5_9ACTN|nr:LacI family DNA-binding transcriptional regulator [Actinomadura fibrosa]